MYGLLLPYCGFGAAPLALAADQVQEGFTTKPNDVL